MKSIVMTLVLMSFGRVVFAEGVFPKPRPGAYRVDIEMFVPEHRQFGNRLCLDAEAIRRREEASHRGCVLESSSETSVFKRSRVRCDGDGSTDIEMRRLSEDVTEIRTYKSGVLETKGLSTYLGPC